MREKVPDRNETELLNKVIWVAYGDARLMEKITILWKAARDENLKHLLDEYKTTAKVAAIGLGLIGLIGFAISMFLNLF